MTRESPSLIRADIDDLHGVATHAVAIRLVARVDAFAQAHPEWPDRDRLELRTRAARLAWPGCKRSDVAIDGQLALAKAGPRLAELVGLWRAAEAAERETRAALAAACREAHEDGASAYGLARATGVGEPAMRKWVARPGHT